MTERIKSKLFVNSSPLRAAVAVAAAALLCATSWADEPSAIPSTPPPAAPAPAPESPKPAKSASLDELLGLPEQPKATDGQPATSGTDPAHEEELQRALNEGDLTDWFEVALESMGVSADLLDQRFDPGLQTQRIQEDILAKLDRLLDAAQRQSSSSGSCSSSSSSSSASRAGAPPRSQSKDAQQPPGTQRSEQALDSQEGATPPLQQGELNTVLDETRKEWGNLPQRVRDMMLQGQTGKFSSLYQKLTQEYYKRLAEDGS